MMGIQYLHANNKENYKPRGHPDFDPLFKVRPILDSVRKQCSALYRPGRAISIDEEMIKFTGRLGFKQYIRGKPTPWSIKVWCAVDSATGYLLDFDVYTGKSAQPVIGGLRSHVVMTVGAKYLDKGYHFYFDNFFASVTLAETRLARKTRCWSTVRTNRKGWPAKLKTTGPGKKKLKESEVKMLQKGCLVATVWQDKRTVAVLSTNVQPVMGAALLRTSRGVRQEKPIPQPILTYNENMGGVDHFDQHRSYYPVGCPGRKWWRYLFWFLVQSSIINAFIIFKITNRPAPKKREDPLTFRLAVFEGLVRGNVCKKRQGQMQPAAVGRGVADPLEHSIIRVHGRKKNCWQCQKQKRSNPGGH